MIVPHITKTTSLHLVPRAVVGAREADGRRLGVPSLARSGVKLPAHVAARTVITSGNPRYAFGAYIDQSIFEHELSADYGQISELTHSVAARLQGTSSVHLTTPLCTDLRLSIAGRIWCTDTGILRGSGIYGNQNI